MKPYYHRVTLLILAAAIFPARVDASSEVTMDVLQAIEMALGNNIDLMRHANTVDASEVQVSMSKTAFLPVLEASLAPSLHLGKHFDAATSEYVGMLGGSFSLGLGLNLMLFDGLASVATLQSSRLELEAGELQLTRAQQETVLATVSAYIEVVSAEEIVEMGSENVAVEEQLLELVKALEEAGKALWADVLKQQAELEKARLVLIEATSDVEIARIALAQVLGVKQGTSVNVLPLGVSTGDHEPPGIDLDSAVAFALESRPDALAAEKQLEAKKKLVKAQKAGYSPRISLFLNVSTSWSSTTDATYGFSDQMFVNNPSGVFGLSVSVPIFDGLLTRYRVESAWIAVTSTQLDVESLDQQIVLQVSQAFEDLEKATAQLEVAEKQLEYASQSRSAYEEVYVEGSCTLADLTQSRALELQATTDVIHARYGVLLGAMAVACAMGDSEAMLNIISAGGE